MEEPKGFKVLLFAQAREVVGSDSLLLAGIEQPCTIARIMQEVSRVHPQIGSLLPTSILAVNMKYIPLDSTQEVNFKDEIALIPPISGG